MDRLVNISADIALLHRLYIDITVYIVFDTKSLFHLEFVMQKKMVGDIKITKLPVRFAT